jgi:simple sugar transport system permease protein
MKKAFGSPNLPVFATAVVFVLLFTTASVLYPGFFSLRVLVNLLGDNSVLGIAAVGMTLVILSGGIDLSVGSVLALTTILIASMVNKLGIHPALAIAAALCLGTMFGAAMGFLIQRYELPAFLVTLGGMFLARGLAFGINQESQGISHRFYTAVQDFSIPLPARASMGVTALCFLSYLLVGIALTHWTRFGRNVFAVGGNEQSARLMGLPVSSTRIGVYAFNGFSSALAGVVATFYMGSGNPASGAGFELDVIASVVIGGTLLTGGVGSQLGTFLGVLIFGTIQTALVFDGRLNSWWLRICIGTLLLVFILLQRFLTRTAAAVR